MPAIARGSPKRSPRWSRSFPSCAPSAAPCRTTASIVDEVTQIGFAARLAFPTYAPRTFLSPGYQDNLGWGYGTALGAQAAMPGRAVVSIAGDGGFMYQVQELATAVQHNLPVVVVVFDNGAFGNVKLLQKERFDSHFIACDLKNPDFCALAESFGAAAFRARDAAELEAALKKAFALRKPALVHVPCGEMPSPWPIAAHGSRPAVTWFVIPDGGAADDPGPGNSVYALGPGSAFGRPG
ncbi:MAG: thiamine pyrophosphate-dependent enzyme [Rhodoblastus sp.]